MEIEDAGATESKICVILRHLWLCTYCYSVLRIIMAFSCPVNKPAPQLHSSCP